jgi:glycosyltransferase involved in cell wall biosynthesis
VTERPDVIIPAHNEAATVAAVVAAARASMAVGSIIVVADASTDRTIGQAADADLVVVTDAADKGSAIAAGLEHSTSRLVVMLDADLSGLMPEHVAALATRQPLEGMVVGLRSNKGWAGGLPSLSGERRLPRSVLELADPAGAGWQLETRINAVVGQLGLPWRHLLLRGVSNPTKVGRDPLGWLAEVGQVAAASAANARGLAAYVTHPHGKNHTAGVTSV